MLRPVTTPEGRVVAALIASAGIDLMDLAAESEAHPRPDSIEVRHVLHLQRVPHRHAQQTVSRRRPYHIL